jgi:predicted PhzF superfamily epimerase YddE/YHI9
MSATKYPIWVVNAFSGEAYSGNPAAVVFVDADRDADLSDEERRKIGGQMNLSETAFVTPIKLKPGSAWTPAHASYGLRWFTPDGTEVPLCGHATLATATALFDELKLTAPELSFMTQSGELKVTRHGIEADTGRSQLCMVLPNNAPTPVAECSAEVQAVSSAIVSVVNKALPGALEVMEAQWSASTKKLLLRLPDDPLVAHLRAQGSGSPSLSASEGSMAALLDTLPASLPDDLHGAHREGTVVRGVIIAVTASTTPPRTQTGTDGSTGQQLFDYQSRYFAPWVGIPEDPVTGSAHTVSAPYMAKVHDDDGNGSNGPLRARQCSRRGGNMRVRVAADAVTLIGTGTVVLRGELEHSK